MVSASSSMTHGLSLWDVNTCTLSQVTWCSAHVGGAKWPETNRHRQSCTTGSLMASRHLCPFLSCVKRLQQNTTVWIRELYELHFLSSLLDHRSKLNAKFHSQWECLIACVTVGLKFTLLCLSHSPGCFVSVCWNVNMAWFFRSVWMEKYSHQLISVQTNG